MPAATSAFTLECPKCSACDSFASLITDEYLKEFEGEEQPKRITYQ